MPRRERPTIALLATHGAAASVLYGMYDLFHSAGRDWPPMIGLPPGESAFHPLIVARDTAPLNVVNDIVVTPQVALRALHIADLLVADREIALPLGIAGVARIADDLAFAAAELGLHHGPALRHSV